MELLGTMARLMLTAVAAAAGLDGHFRGRPTPL